MLFLTPNQQRQSTEGKVRGQIRDIPGGVKLWNGSRGPNHTLFSDESVIGYLGLLSSSHPAYSKLKLLTSSAMKIWTAMQNVENGVVYGHKVIGNVTIQYSTYDYLFNFNTCLHIYVLLFTRYKKSFVELLIFTYPTHIWHPGCGWPSSNFTKIFGINNLRSLGIAGVILCLAICSPITIKFSGIVVPHQILLVRLTPFNT